MPARCECLHERLVCKDVEFRHLLALDVLRARKSKNIDQSRFIDLAGDDLSSQGDLRQQAGKIPGRPGILPLLFHDMSAQGKAQSTHGMTFQMQREPTIREGRPNYLVWLGRYRLTTSPRRGSSPPFPPTLVVLA
jgi:hypothetical protein